MKMPERNEISTNLQTPTGLSPEAPIPTVQEQRDTKRERDASNSNWALVKDIVPETIGSGHA